VFSGVSLPTASSLFLLYAHFFSLTHVDLHNTALIRKSFTTFALPIAAARFSDKDRPQRKRYSRAFASTKLFIAMQRNRMPSFITSSRQTSKGHLIESCVRGTTALKHLERVDKHSQVTVFQGLM
jgi:hypothetical protein